MQVKLQWYSIEQLIDIKILADQIELEQPCNW